MGRCGGTKDRDIDGDRYGDYVDADEGGGSGMYDYLNGFLYFVFFRIRMILLI